MSKVHSEGHVAVVDSNGRHIIPYNSTLATKIQQFVQHEIVNAPGATRLYLENGTYIGYTKIQQHVRTRSDREVCSMHAKQQSEGASAPSVGVSPMASVGKAHTCPPAQSPETKLQIMLLEQETPDAGTDDEAIVVERPSVVAVRRDVASGHAQRRTWCDVCMRARGIAGRHEKREPGREDEGPLVAIEHGCWNLDGTDDDDEDDQVAQNKLLILVAKDVKTGTYTATCPRERGVSEYAMSWLVTLLRRLSFVDLVLRESPVPTVFLSLPCVRSRGRHERSNLLLQKAIESLQETDHQGGDRFHDYNVLNIQMIVERQCRRSRRSRRLFRYTSCSSRIGWWMCS